VQWTSRRAYGIRQRAVGGLMGGIGSRGGKPHGRMLPQLSHFGMNVAKEYFSHCAIDRSICVRWHGVYQFLARRNIQGTFKQTGLRYSSRQLYHCVMAGSSVARRQYMS
jgi:hypothetical protein